MSELPTTDSAASNTANVVEEVVKQGENAADAAIIAAEPAMATPVWKQIWEFFLGLAFNYVGNALAKMAGFVVIDIQQYLALKNASAALAQLQAAQKSGDPNALSQANANMDAAVAPILHYIGSVSTS